MSQDSDAPQGPAAPTGPQAEWSPPPPAPLPPQKAPPLGGAAAQAHPSLMGGQRVLLYPVP